MTCFLLSDSSVYGNTLHLKSTFSDINVALQALSCVVFVWYLLLGLKFFNAIFLLLCLICKSNKRRIVSEYGSHGVCSLGLSVFLNGCEPTGTPLSPPHTMPLHTVCPHTLFPPTPVPPPHTHIHTLCCLGAIADFHPCRFYFPSLDWHLGEHSLEAEDAIFMISLIFNFKFYLENTCGVSYIFYWSYSDYSYYPCKLTGGINNHLFFDIPLSTGTYQPISKLNIKH